MREALIRLEERGYVHRTQGARTSPNRRLPGVGRRIDQQFDHLLSIRSAGYDATLDLVSSERVTLTPGIHRFDDLPDGTGVLRTVKMWRVDGAPYALAEDLVPVTREAEVDPHRPVFALAEAVNGVRVAWETLWIEASGLDAARAGLLSATPSTPVIEMTYCGYGADDAIGYWSREVQLPAPPGLRNALIRRVRA
ncbi:hypothetical protein HR12_34475 [Microbacterium sp. SUBG005]|nr:hypothetical protein HR12_34475 [Microbacterium sp. SUBG005]